MADRPQRLGRGLAALLGGQGTDVPGPPSQGEAVDAPPGGGAAAVDATDGAIGAGELIMLEVARIGRNADQPRRRFDESALEALAASIAESGLVQPVVVRREGDGFVLIAGERRWRAAQRAGLERIPALLREADEREQLEIALVENVVREDLNPIELAHAVAALVEDFGRTHDDVARTLGRSRPAISNLLRLLELPDVVQEMVSDGRLTEGHGRAVLAADGAGGGRRLSGRIGADRPSVPQAEALARREGTPESLRPRRNEIAGGQRILDGFYGAFQVPVRVRAAGGGAVVELRFPDAESLARALERIERAPSDAEGDAPGD